ncbi:hypothetical protein HHK36_008956 [Tetracentron sinense]|uniref:Uncharacterized protein n=1 Tax=Tetracentron sinense TaxID=13715 RepID=A0A834Z9T7_TETSI|nr:hypothetical protein HHK36_008956 [Tetracentron sinense]
MVAMACISTAIGCTSFSFLSSNSTPRRLLSPWKSPQFPNHGFGTQSLSISNTCSSPTATFASAASPFEISPPPIDHDLLDTMTVAGAKVSEDGTIETFGNDDVALNAIDEGVVVVDLSHFGRIRVSGEDRVQFLHNQSTANFECLCDGQGCDTVFATPTARTIDIAHAWVMKNAITLVVSPVTCGSIVEMLAKYVHHVLVDLTKYVVHSTQACCAALMLSCNRHVQQPIRLRKPSWDDKYIFFADKVEIHDITKQTCFFVLVGPKSNQVWNYMDLSLISKLLSNIFLHRFEFDEVQMFVIHDAMKVMEDLNLGDLVGQPYGTHQHYTVNGMPITVGVGNIISEEGFSLLLSPAAAGSVWKTLLSLGAIPMGAKAWERLRIFQGRPAPGKELTNEFNVLEAGLWNAVSVNKGCYKGQETISRLITYDGVKQRLWGLHLSAQAEPGSPITIDGKKVGKLTSYAPGRKESEHVGLGYIKRQVASDGGEVNVGDIVGTVVEVPFLARQSPPQTRSPSA